MISAIFKTPVEVKHVNRLPEKSLTDATIQKFVLGILATITISISYLAFTVGGAALLLAIPTLVIGGVLAWTIIRIKDYQDAKKLEQYQTEAARVPLDQTIKTHGWKNMFLYDIPKKEAFDIRYREYMKDLSMPEIITIYENANTVLDTLIKEEKIEPSLELPAPAKFIRNFDAEVQNLTPIQMIDRYDLEKLYEHKIIPKDLLDAKESYKKALTTRAEKQKSTDSHYWTARKGIHEQFTLECSEGKPTSRINLQKSLEDLDKFREQHLVRINQEFQQFCEELNARFADRF